MKHLFNKWTVLVIGIRFACAIAACGTRDVRAFRYAVAITIISGIGYGLFKPV